jgi:hypothetical protein
MRFSCGLAAREAGTRSWHREPGTGSAATVADERLQDSFHAARTIRSKIGHDLEPRYGIEP